MQFTSGYLSLDPVTRHHAIMHAMQLGVMIRRFMKTAISKYATSIGSIAIVQNEKASLFLERKIVMDNAEIIVAVDTIEEEKLARNSSTIVVTDRSGFSQASRTIGIYDFYVTIASNLILPINIMNIVPGGWEVLLGEQYETSARFGVRCKDFATLKKQINSIYPNAKLVER